MPNTLAHIGGQGLLSRGLLRSADGRWILLAAMLPDLPWIVQRLLGHLGPPVAPHALRAYCIVQASLLFCLILSAALAALARRPGSALGALSLGVLLHLLLDACQIKWGGGVHLLAPLSWRVLNIGLFWPESWITVVLMLLGVVVVVNEWRRPVAGPLLSFKPVRVLAALGLALVYVVAPLWLAGGVEAADTHMLATLRHPTLRPGRDVALDRVPVSMQNGPVVRTLTGEQLRLTGTVPEASGRVSLRGRFLDPETIQVEALHRHAPVWRDLASYAGLLLIAAAWLRPLERRPG